MGAELLGTSPPPQPPPWARTMGHMRRMRHGPQFVALGLALVAAVACQRTAAPDSPAQRPPTPSHSSQSVRPHENGATMHPYVGMWVTADHHIRQELLPEGRYDEARGERASAYTGRYWVKGNRIEYLDDTGFSADGEFDGDVLHHGGYIFYREGSPAHREAVGDRDAGLRP